MEQQSFAFSDQVPNEIRFVYYIFLKGFGSRKKYYSSSSQFLGRFSEFLCAYEILQCWDLHRLIKAMSGENEDLLNIMKLFCIMGYNEIDYPQMIIFE